MHDLIAVASSPVPDDHVSGSVTTADGVRLRYARFAAPRRRRGTVIILEGRGEFIEHYFETVEDLRRRGFAVVCFDWRGQGGSQRLLADPRKGHVRDFADYLTDFETVMHQVVLADCRPPYFILGHSTGGAVALLAAARARTQIERMVLTAPLLGLARPSRAWLAPVSGLLCYLGIAESYVPGGGRTVLQTYPFDGNRVTSDPVRYRRATDVVEAAPGLGIGSATIGWLNAAMRAVTRMEQPAFADQVPVPVLMVVAGAESIVSNAAIERLSARLKTGAHLRIPGARHEILMERDVYRSQFWAAFDAFIAAG